MADFTSRELDLMSRALERALSSLRGSPRANYTTGDLAAGIFNAAVQGQRCEETLAGCAIAYAKIAARAPESADA